MMAGRMKNPLLQLIKSAFPRIDSLALYRAKVIGQSGSTVDLQPDDARLPMMSKVPIRHGLPGVSLTVQPGTSILVGWENGDPAHPYACLWEGGETVMSLQLAGNTAVARKDDHTNPGKLTLTVGGAATLAWTYVDADGVTTTGVSGAPITLKGKISEGSSIVGAG
jgi:hypothetical protein